jgi:hypothetical protein
MGNLASSQLNTQSDPALVLQQAIANREKQYASITNPQQQVAARLGGLLGGGLVNLYQDRGFFDINDPLLNKVSQIQGVYNEVASRIDPAADPAKFYSELQKAYGDAGLGREALAAANEAQKAKTTNLDFQLKETALFEKNPELLAGRITTALEQGNEPEANRLANLNARLTEDRELKLEKARTDIAKDRAYIAYQNKLASDEKFEYKPVDPNNPLAGNWKFDKTGKTDPQYVPVPADLAAKFAPPSDKKGSPKLSQEQVNALVNPNQNAANAPVTSAPAAQTTWSGVPVQAKPVTPLTAMQERDLILQRSYPTLVISTLDETAKAQLAQQLGL